MKIAIALAVSLAALTGVASAQNYGLAPTYGTAQASAGFLPDPYTIATVTAGGSINASNVGCAGMIADAPDVRLNWTGGQFSIGATSSVDTTIVVNGADGQWYCNDDFNGLNPRVTVSGSGQYDIWIGTYGGGYAGNTSVYITEY